MLSPITRRSTGPFGLAMLCLSTAIICESRCFAAELPSFDGFDVRWDNTLSYSAAVRIEPANPLLIGNPNDDDGDRDFAAGLVSNRLDLRSVLNISKDNFGVEASIEAWYDSVYHAGTDNKSPATYNAISVPNTVFPRATRNLEGQYIDLTNTFAFWNFDAGDTPLTVRVGRQTLSWGESIFFDENSIASAQSPIDYWKTIVSPNGYASDVYLPVGQFSVSAQPRSDLALAAYYQFEWRPSRLFGVGSYFSTTDVLGVGAERLFLGSGQFLLHGQDREPSNGQYGLSIHKTLGDLDLGLYALTYSAKYPGLFTIANPAAVWTPGPAGQFYSAYPKGIQLYGASFSTYVGDSNVMGEIVARHNAPFAAYASPQSFPMTSFSWQGARAYARGDELHADVSSATTLSPMSVWDSADLHLEIAADTVLSVAQYSAIATPPTDQLSASVRALFEPHYFEVLPNLDLTLPVGFGYNELSQYGDDYTSNPKGGDFEAGIAASYFSVWKAGLTITCFLGSPSRQPLADRDFVMFSFERTF